MFLLWLRQLPWHGDQIPALVPPPTEGRSSPTNTPVPPRFPSSYRVLCGSMYSFPLLRSSCPLSAGVFHALLCLKVCSWCIRGERCTPCPPIPLPSCSPPGFFFPFSDIDSFFFFSSLLSQLEKKNTYPGKIKEILNIWESHENLHLLLQTNTDMHKHQAC